MPRRKIMLNATEVLALQHALDLANEHRDYILADATCTRDQVTQANLTVRGISSLLEKVSKASEEGSRGASLAWAEEALSGSRKYAKFAGGNAAALSARLGQLGVTREQLQVVGAWADRQSWLDNYDMGLLLAKWTGWLARAMSARSTFTVASSAPAGFED